MVGVSLCAHTRKWRQLAMLASNEQHNSVTLLDVIVIGVCLRGARIGLLLVVAAFGEKKRDTFAPGL